MKIKKGDTIKIMVGKDKGKTGKVLKALPGNGTVSVEGLNLYKKHVKPKQQGEKGQTVLVLRPIRISNVMIICPSCARAVRVGYRVNNKGKTRICKKCGAPLS
jgi:large subunit ribosomal protein L24